VSTGKTVDLKFGDFLFHQGTQELSKNGAIVALQPRQCQVLAMLLYGIEDHAGT
jgi:DNA-binding winged helix-turn-helix (wHTH) protein